jgi:hypothetical protein
MVAHASGTIRCYASSQKNSLEHSTGNPMLVPEPIIPPRQLIMPPKMHKNHERCKNEKRIHKSTPNETFEIFE